MSNSFIIRYFLFDIQYSSFSDYWFTAY